MLRQLLGFAAILAFATVVYFFFSPAEYIDPADYPGDNVPQSGPTAPERYRDFLGAQRVLIAKAPTKPARMPVNTTPSSAQ